MSKRTIQQGDRVIIREWDDMASQYRYIRRFPDTINTRFGFTTKMRMFCGAKAEVLCCVSNKIRLLFDDPQLEMKSKGFYFSEDMLKLVDENPFEIGCVDEFICDFGVGFE